MHNNDRLNAFKRLREEIRGSEKHLLIGIDIAKERHHAFFGTSTRMTLLKQLIFENTKDGFDKLIQYTDEIKKANSLEKVVYAVEPTASYHNPLAEYLIGRNKQVVYVSNVAVKNNRVLIDGRWDKNDKKDAANIADLVSQGKCIYYDMPDAKVLELRNLLSSQVRLKKEEHRIRMRIRNNLMARYFPELDVLCPQTDDIVLKVVERALDTSEISDMTLSEFIKTVACGSSLRIGQKEKLRTIWEAAAQSIGCASSDAAKWEATLQTGYIRDIRSKIRENEKRIEEAANRFSEYKYLLTIPGFGPVISSMVLGAIGNAAHFENRRQVLRLAGLDLCAVRSGKKSDSVTPVISKQGKAHLRYMLVQAAKVASSSNMGIKKYYNHILAGREKEKGIKLKMKVKLAAKLLVVAWTLMKKKERFDINCFNMAQ